MGKPVVIDLFCGRFGWSKGFVAEGYRAIGFDLNPPIGCDIPEGCELLLQDVATVSGYHLRSAFRPTIIVASPPCQAYSYMAMPWDRAKREMRWQQWERTSLFTTGFTLNNLFDACFRIAREASCPIVVENVKGAQPWVGPAKAHYRAQYLWGDVPPIMPYTDGKRKAQQFVQGAKVPVGTGSTSWFFGNTKHELRGTSSGSIARKAASAAIAEIPFDLAQWIARCFKP